MNARSSTCGAVSWILLVACFPWTGYCQHDISHASPLPSRCQREAYANGSYSHWLQNLQLKERPVILNHRSQTVESPFYKVWGVVHLPLLFQSDLEQCADFAMRLWAEYHKSAGKLDQLYLFDYGGNKKQFAQSGKSYSQFLRWAFSGANSHSLKSGCKEIPESQIMPGDMFVQNERGGIGHVSVVMDVCRSPKGGKLLLVGYSFMPAQEFHIEKADRKYGVEGWFTVEGYRQYLLDHLNYGTPVLRRFESR